MRSFTTNFISNTIENKVVSTRGINAWISRVYIIRDILGKLKPDKPEDNTSGFLAYNIPDNPYKRVKMKTGRFLTRKLNLNGEFLTDVALRNIADTINNELWPDCKYHLVSGSEIQIAYENAIGGRSCMTGGSADKVGMYVDNQDTYRLAVMSYNGDSARAIIVRLNNGSFFMDRIYSTCSLLEDKLIEIAEKEGWFYRTSSQAGVMGISDYNGKPVEDYSIFVVSGLEFVDGEIPYQDTLTRYALSKTGCRISICHNRNGMACDGVLDSTEGYIAGGEDYDNCYECEDNLHTDNLIYVEGAGCSYCESCWSELFFNCEYCDETATRDDMIEIVDRSQWWCEDCASSHATKCSECGEINVEEYNLIEDCIYCYSCEENLPKCKCCEEKVMEVNDDNMCTECQEDKDAEVKIRKDAETVAYYDRANLYQT